VKRIQTKPKPNQDILLEKNPKNPKTAPNIRNLASPGATMLRVMGIGG
jgi:hypothetical protein